MKPFEEQPTESQVYLTRKLADGIERARLVERASDWQWLAHASETVFQAWDGTIVSVEMALERDASLQAVIDQPIGSVAFRPSVDQAWVIGWSGTPDQVRTAHRALDLRTADVDLASWVGLVRGGDWQTTLGLFPTIRHWQARVRVVQFLPEQLSDDALALLRLALRDRSKWVRYRACQAACRSQREDLAEDLKRLVEEDSDPEVNSVARAALVGINSGDPDFALNYPDYRGIKGEATSIVKQVASALRDRWSSRSR